MKRAPSTHRRSSKKYRAVFVVGGIFLLFTGVGSLAEGKLHYFNYFNAPVFAPFAILIAILSFVAAFKSHGNLQR